MPQFRRGQGPEKRHLGRTRTQNLELRARWIVEEWASDVSIRTGEMKRRVIERFRCGEDGADRALSAAYEIMEQARNDPALVDRVAQFYLNLVQESLRNGDRTNARLSMDSLRQHLGLSKPERVELTRPPPVDDHDDLTDEELELLAKLEKRERELEEQTTGGNA